MPDSDFREPTGDGPAFRPRREVPIGTIVIIVLLVLGAAFFGWRWYQQQKTVAPPPVAAAAPDDAPAPPPPPPPAPVPTGPQNLVDALAQPDSALPTLDKSDARVQAALNELLGARSVASFLQIDGIVRRFVATVDNLPRGQAPSRMWPVQPTSQHFIAEGEGGTQTIAANNAARYGAFVLFAESIDAAKAAAVYAKLYPLFQAAYEELGYPGRYFNDRLVAVLDHLLLTPELKGPLQVRLVEVKGDVPSQRPWVRYEFADPQLEALSAGQKILVRMGPANERRLKVKLAELRRQVATGAVAKKQ